MPDFIQGLASWNDIRGQLPVSWQAYFSTEFGNQFSFTQRQTFVPIDAVENNLSSDLNRPGTVTLAASPTAAGTTLTLVDASYLMNGDVIRLSTNEFVEVVDHPNVVANTIVVRRGVGTAQSPAVVVPGTDIVSVASAPANVGKIIGNSRRGNEVDQLAIQPKGGNRKQYTETFQHVVQVGDGQNRSVQMLPRGMSDLLGKNRAIAAQNMNRDRERSALYGVGEAPTDGPGVSRPKEYGITRFLKTTNVNQPTNFAAFKPVDLAAAVEKVADAGGSPDTIYWGRGVNTAIATWTLPYVSFNGEPSAFGTKTQAFRLPFLGDLTIVPCPELEAGSLLITSSEDIYMGVRRPVKYEPYGRRGDAKEGDWITEEAIIVNNEHRHGLFTGITGYAPMA